MQRVHGAMPGCSTAARAVLCSGALLLLGAAACGTPRIDKPRGPDMTALDAVYRAPDAEFTSSAADEIALAISVIDELLARTSLREQLVDVLVEVLNQASELSQLEGEFTFEADGYMRITRVCAGWTLPAQPDRGANGALLITATFSQAGLDPILWGAAEACRYRAGDAQIELDQVRDSAEAVSVYWGDGASERGVSERTLLVDLDLAASVDGERVPLDIDFRSLADGTIEYRIPRPDGSLMARVGAGDTITLRAQNGDFECDAALDCRQPGATGEP